MPAASSQPTIASMSPISPMPQLRDEGIENSGISVPARRDPGRGGVIRRNHARCKQNAAQGAELRTSRARTSKQSRRGVSKDARRRQQADDEERLALKVEEISRMHEDP